MNLLVYKYNQNSNPSQCQTILKKTINLYEHRGSRFPKVFAMEMMKKIKRYYASQVLLEIFPPSVHSAEKCQLPWVQGSDMILASCSCGHWESGDNESLLAKTDTQTGVHFCGLTTAPSWVLQAFLESEPVGGWRIFSSHTLAGSLFFKYMKISK